MSSKKLKNVPSSGTRVGLLGKSKSIHRSARQISKDAVENVKRSAVSPCTGDDVVTTPTNADTLKNPKRTRCCSKWLMISGGAILLVGVLIYFFMTNSKVDDVFDEGPAPSDDSTEQTPASNTTLLAAQIFGTLVSVVAGTYYK